jgi:hypothetical protein
LSSVIDEETPYRIVAGENDSIFVGYLPEDDEAILTASMTAREYTEAMCNRDYETTDGADEYAYYSMEMLDKLIAEGDQEGTLKWYAETQAVSELLTYEIDQINFNVDRNVCAVIGTIAMMYTHGTEDFLSESDITLNEPVVYNVGYRMVLESNIWKIDEFIFRRSNVSD